MTSYPPTTPRYAIPEVAELELFRLAVRAGPRSCQRLALGRHRSDAPHDVAARLKVDASRRHVRFHAGGRPFVGLDPCYGQHADGRWAPLVLEGHLD